MKDKIKPSSNSNKEKPMGRAEKLALKALKNHKEKQKK